MLSLIHISRPLAALAALCPASEPLTIASVWPTIAPARSPPQKDVYKRQVQALKSLTGCRAVWLPAAA